MIGLDFSCTFVLFGLLGRGHPDPRRLVHVVVRVYPHLVLDVAEVLEGLARGLLDALERAAALDVRQREAELLHIVTVVGRKGQMALPVDELDGGVQRAAQFELIPLELLDGPQGRVSQLDEDELLVVAGGAAVVLLGQSIVASAQGGHLDTGRPPGQVTGRGHLTDSTGMTPADHHRLGMGRGGEPVVCQVRLR